MYQTFICVFAPITGISFSIIHMSSFSIHVKFFSPRFRSWCRLRLSAPLRPSHRNKTKNRITSACQIFQYMSNFSPPLSVSVSTQTPRTTQTLASEQNQKSNCLRALKFLITKKSLNSLWDFNKTHTARGYW